MKTAASATSSPRLAPTGSSASSPRLAPTRASQKKASFLMNAEELNDWELERKKALVQASLDGTVKSQRAWLSEARTKLHRVGAVTSIRRQHQLEEAERLEKRSQREQSKAVSPKAANSAPGTRLPEVKQTGGPSDLTRARMKPVGGMSPSQSPPLISPRKQAPTEEFNEAILAKIQQQAIQSQLYNPRLMAKHVDRDGRPVVFVAVSPHSVGTLLL